MGARAATPATDEVIVPTASHKAAAMAATQSVPEVAQALAVSTEAAATRNAGSGVTEGTAAEAKENCSGDGGHGVGSEGGSGNGDGWHGGDGYKQEYGGGKYESNV